MQLDFNTEPLCKSCDYSRFLEGGTHTYFIVIKGCEAGRITGTIQPHFEECLKEVFEENRTAPHVILTQPAYTCVH